MASWWKKLVNNDNDHQHQPLPLDEHDDEGGYRPPHYAQQPDDGIPSWLRWIFPRPGADFPADYRPPVVHHDNDLRVRDDEASQVEQAIRQSLQEEALREELERDDHVLRRAMEISKKEAEEAAKRNAELALVPVEPPPPVILPDLMNMDPLPVDLLGPAPDEHAGKDLMLLTDEAIARSLQQEINLLDDDSAVRGGHDMLATLTRGERAGSVALPPGALGLPSGWETPNGPSVSSDPSPLALPAPPATPAAFFNSLVVLCGGCHQPISFGRYLTCLGHSWHPQCFRCKACNQTIVDKEFKAMGSDPYHSECHRQLFHPKCSVCNDYVPTKSGGVIEYRSMPFWGDQYCPHHDTDATARCTACHRLEKRDTPYVTLDDGRKLCLNCVETVVVDTKDCTPLFRSILDFFQGLGMKITQDIPLLCVETQALNAARAGEHRQGHQDSPETRGLCLSEEQTIQTVVRLPGFPGGGLRGIGQQEQQLTRHCEVTAILVLYGLPQLLTGSILAHELMHAYLKLNGRFPKLAPEVEEGVCQVMAHLWLQSQAGKFGNGPSANPNAAATEYSKKFAEFCMHQIATDISPVYGEGFRKGHAAVLQFGLKQTLDHIQLTANFP